MRRSLATSPAVETALHVGCAGKSACILCLAVLSCAGRLIFKLLHKKHVPPYVEVSTVMAGAYTVYLGTGVTHRAESTGSSSPRFDHSRCRTAHPRTTMHVAQAAPAVAASYHPLLLLMQSTTSMALV